ncbi:chemotaxis protein CheA [Spirochaeta cellobiosiphila]|uniref:chemotaxis protein CheA n=1 Tax=Spirochaeta cellobiosiphila TaxID=504483 RepID=UPI0003FF28A8|nr:chemotaxis protein CheA [Spirochaeta cellobiosiphila]
MLNYSNLIDHLNTLDPDDLLDIANLIEEIEESGETLNSADSLGLVLKYLKEMPHTENIDRKDELLVQIKQVIPNLKKKSGIYIEDMEVLHSFITEAIDHLDNIESRIIKLEKGFDEDQVDSLFRSMHTIKGVASFLGLDAIQNLGHNLENLLDKIRAQMVEVDSHVIDILLAGTDLMNNLISQISYAAKEAPMEGHFHLDINNTMPDELLEQIQNIITSGHLKKELANSDDSFDMESLITTEMKTKFAEETADMIDLVERTLLELEDSSDPIELVADAFRSVHTVKGNAGFFGYEIIEKLSMDIEEILDGIRKEKRHVDKNVINVLLSGIDGIRKNLSSIQSGSGELNNLDVYKPLGEILVEMGAASSEDLQNALDKQNRRLGDILVDSGSVKKEDIDAALSQQSINKASDIVSHNIKRKDIRVDTDKLDKLFDLIGELITAEAMVLDNEEVKRFGSDSFNKAATYIAKITRELQEVTMSIRMIPLEGMFNRMKRLVRDLSHKFKKDIDFKISGQDTEMDRNIIEEISDPMVHLIRNAIDHGIEDQDVRLGQGKAKQGCVTLDAKYEGNEIWITLSDDGKGLDRDKILIKAKEKGIINDDKILEDKEVWDLIFEPGFSTADKVSEISGRGVGMDVVKKNIEKLRGQISIESMLGRGTSFILKIPLTLAIIDGVNLQVGKRLFSIPVTDVLEFQSVHKSQITETDIHGEVLNLRSELIPIIRLYDFYRISDAVHSIEDGVIIVVTSNGKKAAILSDHVLGYKQIVLKALPEYMGDIIGLSGCSIMGNGDVSLILDVGTLYKEVLN